MKVVIRGHELPGRRFCGPDGDLENVHVGLQVRKDVEDLVPGDATSATWEAEVRLVRQDGHTDFRGPAVQGRRGDRFLYLSWGDVDADGAFGMFRRAKLMLSRIDAGTLRSLEDGMTLEARLGLSDSCGEPVCAAVGPDRISWTVK